MVARPSQPAVPLSPHANERRSHPLPLQPTPIIGRDAEIAALQTRLTDPGVRLLTLTGPPGTGKTRLALAVAESVLSGFPDGVWFVALESVRNPDAVIAAIARALDLRLADSAPVQDALQAYLRERHALLVLDNFEQVLAAGVRVADLLSAAPRLTVLVTSRAPLRLRWEQEAPVPPLALPDTVHADDPATVAGAPAVRLFVERATAVRPDFRLTADNAGAVAEICRRLDGLPLAIELAAARTRLLPPDALLARLERRLSLLTGGARDLPARHQTLRAALDWSYDLLSREEQRFFRGLGAFAGGCTVEAAAAVCGAVGSGEWAVGDSDPAAPTAPVLDLLTALLEHALVRREVGPGDEPRYRMLATVREYAADRLAESVDAEAARGRHAAYFLALAEQAEGGLRGPAQGEWLARLDADLDNVRVVLGWALAEAEVELGVRIAVALARFWGPRGHAAEGRRWLERLLATDAFIPPQWRARAMQTAGDLAILQGDYGSARAVVANALALREEIGDPREIAMTLNSLGNIAWQQGDYGDARRFYEQCLALLRDVGDRWRTGIALNNLGNVVSSQGEFGTARALYEEGLALARDLGDTTLIAVMVQNLGDVAHRQGDAATARTLFEESLAQRRALGDKAGIGVALCNLGELALERGETAAARALVEESLALRRELGDRLGLGFTLSALAAVSRREGDPAAAWRLVTESLRLRQEIGDKSGVADCLERGASIAIDLGLPLLGARLFGAVEALREGIGAPLTPAVRAEHDRAVAGLHASLGANTVATAWAEGRSLSLDAAIDLMLAPLPAEAPAAPATAAPSDAPRRARASLPDGLTAREAEVLGLIAEGIGNQAIAERLVLSLRTVEHHIASIYRKIGARGRADAVAYALRHGLST